MTTLIPTASACHTLQLPPTEKDDRLNLIVRTGSSSTLYNSLILTFGGLTIGLELYECTISEIQLIFSSKILNSNLRFKTIDKYLSGEFFYLKLIDRTWRRVAIEEGESRPQPRVFHEICATNNCAYIFGGLVLDAETMELVPCNDLWEFNLQTSKWTLLHDGADWKENLAVPQPRFNHKLTTINSLTFVNKRDHFGIFIAGGKDSSSQAIYDNYVFDLVDKKYVGNDPVHLKVTTGNAEKDTAHGLDDIANIDENHDLSVDYLTSIIVSIDEDLKEGSHRHHHHHHHHATPSHKESLTDLNYYENTPTLSNFEDDDEHNQHRTKNATGVHRHEPAGSIIVYTPTTEPNINPLLSFKLGKHIRNGRPLALHRKRDSLNCESIPNLYDSGRHSTLTGTNKKTRNIIYNVPYNLRYPTGGLFGQNLVITGFLPDDYNISIFIFNMPTGKWSRLNIFCNHDYGSHRFWGGFAWQSHHKVVLIGNYISSRTTSSIRFFTLMITVSLPVTNILASSELAYGHHNSEDKKLAANLSELKATGEDLEYGSKNPTESDSSSSGVIDKISDDDESSSVVSDEEDTEASAKSIGKESNMSPPSDNAPISFTEYVHYAAPKTTTSKIRSVFPPAAITLGRNGFDRYEDLISDFEMVSSNGDRIPVSLTILIERWGRYFIQLLAKGYVQAVNKFDLDMTQDNSNSKLRTSKTSLSTNSSFSSAKLKSSTGALSASSVSSEGGLSDDHFQKAIPKSKHSHDPKKTKKDLSLPKEKGTLYHLSMPTMTSKQPPKDAPQFRLPFQNTSEDSFKKSESVIPNLPEPKSHSTTPSIQQPGPLTVPVELPPPRRESTSSYMSNNSSLLTSHLQDIPPQLPLPQEQIPDVPTTPVSFKSPSWRGSNAGTHDSPRASLLHTLTALRNIPSSRSPRDSPYTSPRASISAQGNAPQPHADLLSTTIPNLRPSGRSKSIDGSLSDFNVRNLTQANPDHDLVNKKKHSSSYVSLSSVDYGEKNFSLSSTMSEAHSNVSSGRDSSGDDRFDPRNDSVDPIDYNSDEGEGESLFGNLLLNFENIEIGKFRMEPSLIPRKLYVPFSTITLKAFSEYLYTGQVGNKWLLTPTAVDNLAIARFFNVPLLYDLISEVFFGIIGRKEAHVIKEGKKLKKKLIRLHDLTDTPLDKDFVFPLDHYEGFLDTVDDGYLDLALLKNTSRIHKNSSVSVSSSRKKRSMGSSFSYKASVGIDSELAEEPSGELNDMSEFSGDKIDEGYLPHEHTNTEDVDKLKSSNSEVKSIPHSEIKENKGPTTDDPKESTDDSTDRLNSTSEEDNEFGLGFLQTNDFTNPTINPRSKSVFDKSSYVLNAVEHGTAFDNEEAEHEEEQDTTQGLTLEQLVSPDSPVPNEGVINAIYEIACLVTDLKLMLRASNARQMNTILIQTRLEFGDLIEKLQEKYNKQREERENELVQLLGTGFESESSSIYTEYKRSQSYSSLSNTFSKSQSQSTSDLRLKGRLSGFSRLTPFTFKGTKTESHLGFNEIDKQISKLKKKNEKELAKQEKVEKLLLEKQAKVEKTLKQKADKKLAKAEKISTGKNNKLTAKLGISKSQTDLDSDSVFSASTRTIRKHHTFFHIGHRKKELAASRDDDSLESALMHTPSNSGSVNSDTSKHSNSTSTTTGSKKKRLFGLKKKSS